MAKETRFTPQPAKRVVDIPHPRASGESVNSGQGKKLTVGRDICLSGQISACETLVVEGTVEAALSDSRTIEIAETGCFKGDVDIDVAEIRGRFEGALTARKRLMIYNTGRVTGRIRYSELEIERGGKIVGEIELLDAKSEREPRIPGVPSVPGTVGAG